MNSIFDSDAFNQRLFFPRSDLTPPPDGAIDLSVPVDGAALHLRWHRSDAARVTLLLFHGNGEVVCDYDGAAPLFEAVGAELAVADFRGYGASTGLPSLRATIADAPLVLEALREHRPKPVVVMGRSLGSACAAELYGAGADLRGVVLESGFTDLEALIARRGLEAPSSFSAPEREVFDPLPKLARGKAPLLVLHGVNDTLISAEEGRAAFEASSTAHKELVLIPNRGHNDVAMAPLYWQALARFIAAL